MFRRSYKKAFSSLFSPFFQDLDARKNDPHIRIPAGFPGVGWSRLLGANCLGFMGLGGLQVTLFPPVVWQSERESGGVSTGTETEGFSGFSGMDGHSGKGKRNPYGAYLTSGSNILF